MARSLIGLFLLLSINLQAFSQKDIWRVEPLHWWVGMNNPELQILIYGEDIGVVNPVIEYPGVELIRTEKVDNSNYLFLYLEISPQTKPGEMAIRLGDQSILYSLKERKKNSADRIGFGPEDVIYLITPDRFANGYPSNDEFSNMEDKLNRTDPFGRHGGDIKGIINHLDYIESMGFTAIWLNPVVENDMPGQSYHGYASTDFYKIDPRYGTLAEYNQLSAECQKRGIKLIMDQIMNHCGSSHWWMKDLPDKYWIHHIDEYKKTSHKRTTLNDPYAAESDIKRFTHGWFVPTMPDMNQDHPLLADYLVQNSIWWVEESDLHGIRHDTHPYAGESFMKEYGCRIMAEYPNFNIVGEEWSINPAIIAKWQSGSFLGHCTPSMFDFPLQLALAESLREDEDWSTGWIKVYEMLSNDFLYADPFKLVTFADNHDMDRFYTQIGEDLDLYKMGMAYFACMRGIPQIYYGTEILMTNSKPGNHGLIRSDFPGGWDSDQENAFTGNLKDTDKLEAQNYLRKLLNWRKESVVIHHGELMHYAPEGGVYCFFRYTDFQTVMVIFNKNMQEEAFDVSQYPEMLSGVIGGFDVLKEKRINFTNFRLAPRSVHIIEILR